MIARFSPGVLSLRSPAGYLRFTQALRHGILRRTTSDEKSTDPQKPVGHKNLGGPLRVIVTTIAIFLISQLIAAFIAELGLGMVHPHASVNLSDSAAAQFFYILIAEALSIWLVLAVLKRRRLNWSFIGLGRRPVWGDLWRAALGFVAFYALLIIVTVIVNVVSPQLNNQQQDVGFNSVNGGLGGVLAFVALVILPPLGEETLMRGYLFSGLRAVWRFGPALLVTSLLFGAAHLTGGDSGLLWSAAIDTFILSIILVYLRDRTGALYAGMLVHMLNNLIAYGVHFHS